MSFDKFRQLNYGIGVMGCVAFLLTGQYMHHTLDHLRGLPDGERMIFRATHMYILMASIMNLMIGKLHQFQFIRGHLLNHVISGLVALSVPSFCLSFFMETPLGQVHRPISQHTHYALFGVALILIFSGFTVERRYTGPGDRESQNLL